MILSEDDAISDSDNGLKFIVFIYCNCSSTEWAICFASIILSFNVLRPLNLYIIKIKFKNIKNHEIWIFTNSLPTVLLHLKLSN